MTEEKREVLFLLLGSNPTLPYSECASILESNNVPYREVKRLDQVMIVSAPLRACWVVANQAGMVRRSCVLLAQSPKTLRGILKAIDDLDLKEIIGPEESFAVRVKGIREHSKGLDTSMLEKEIGGHIKESVNWARVDLEKPGVLFYTIITGDEAFFCLSIVETEERGFSRRRPGSRPFFHPSSMHPRLARTMVNLSGAKPGSRFMDPFCGSGGILVEAGVIGCKLIGVDVDLRMCKGSQKNLRALDLRYNNICMGDARHIPIRDIDSVATDPPYGRSSSTRGRRTFLLVEESLTDIAAILKSRSRVCVSVPSDLRVDELEIGDLSMIEAHSYRVHRSLTRNIVVFAKK